MDLATITRSRPYQIIHHTFRDWMEDNALRLSAALAYYSVFSIAPLLVIAISIAGWALGPEAVSGQLDNQLRRYIGAQAATAVQTMVQSAAKPGDSLVGGIVGFSTLLLGAAGIFGQLKDALNTIWEVKARADEGIWGFLRQRLLNFGMVLVIGFLLMASLLLSTAFAALSAYLDTIFQMPAVLWGSLAGLFSLGMVTVLFAAIFKILPDATVQWRDVWTGAILTALLFELGKFGLGWYLGRESTVSSYGAAGSLVLILLWVYYASCILLLGAEFTRVYALANGHAIGPNAHAVAVTREARAQQGLAVDTAGIAEVEAALQPTLPPKLEPPTPTKPILAMVALGFIFGILTRKSPDQDGK